MGYASVVGLPMVINIKSRRLFFVSKTLIFISNTHQSSLKVSLQDNILYTVDPLRHYATAKYNNPANCPLISNLVKECL